MAISPQGENLVILAIFEVLFRSIEPRRYFFSPAAAATSPQRLLSLAM